MILKMLKSTENMKLIKIKAALSLLLMLAAFALKAVPLKGITVSASSPVVPVLKGMESNPLLRLLIYIPAGEKEILFTKIAAKLNAGGIWNFAINSLQ
jgi:sialidase-1